MILSRTDILLDKVQFKYLFLAVYLLGTSLHGMPSSQVLAEEVRENDSVIEKRILKELREDPFYQKPWDKGQRKRRDRHLDRLY